MVERPARNRPARAFGKSVSRRSPAHSPEWKPHSWKSVIRPGGRSAEHRHPGFIVGYVLEGQIRFAINDETPRVLFYEPTGALHSTSENAQPGMPAKILAFMVAAPGRPIVEGK